MILVVAVALALSATAAYAEPLPLPKPPGPGGSCPHGCPAQAAPQLPNTMLGRHWCFFRAPDDDPDQEASLLDPADNFDDCGHHGGVRFWRRGGKSGYQLGRFDWRADCKISKIELVASKGPNVYRVHSHCRAHRGMFVGDPKEGTKLFELRQSEAGLRWRDLPEN